MSEEVKANKVGVYIDFENIKIPLENQGKALKYPEYGVFREVGESYGNVAIIKPFAVWDGMHREQVAFEECGIKTIPIVSNLKNAADISLTVDCLYNTFTMGLDTVVIFAGDGGYGPLINCLIDDLQRDVLVYSIKGSQKDAVYRRLKKNHRWFDEEFAHIISEGIVPDQTDPNMIMLAIIMDKLHKQYPSIGRSGLYKYILKHPELKKLGDGGCSGLLDTARGIDLIRELIPVWENKVLVRKVELNYDHPIVKELKLLKNT